MTLRLNNRMLQSPALARSRRYVGRLFAAVLLGCFAFTTHAQVYPLGSNGSMGLGSANGDFTVAQDDLRVKVPGGFVRVNRDFDGNRWVFNRQWSGLGNPSFYKATYASIGAFFSCSSIDGISSCDTTASAGTAVVLSGTAPDIKVEQTRVPNDPNFGRDAEGEPLPDLSTIQVVARKGVGFSRSTDGTSYISSKYPRFIVRPQLVPTLPVSAGPDAQPPAGKPGHGGLSTITVHGFRWTDRSGEWIEYDNLGRITSYGDRNDVRVWMQYGNHGQIERVLDDNGRTVFTFIYSGNGSFITEARDHTPLDGSIRRVQYQYDDKGRLRHVIDPLGHITSFDYGALDSVSVDTSTPVLGASGSDGGTGSSSVSLPVDTRYKIAKVTDAEGRVTEIGYGVTARVARIIAPDKGVTDVEYGYDKLKKEFNISLTHPATSAGRSREFMVFDQEGRLVNYEANGKQLLSMQGDWRNARYTDARGSTTQVVRDAFDQVTERTAADGTKLTYRYAAGSLDVAEAVDEAGVKTQFSYDAHGNVRSIDVAAGLPEAQRSEYEFNLRGELERITSKGGIRADGITDPDAQMQLGYDAAGNVAQLTDGEGQVWHYAYNTLGQITRITDPNAHVTAFTYDANGNVLSTIDANGNTTTYTYDKTDRPLLVTDPRGKTSQLSYDAAGRMQRLVDPYGAAVQLQYNAMGQMVAASDAVGQTAHIDYDLFGRMQKLTDGIGSETVFDYSDSDGQDRGNGLVTKIASPTLTRLMKYNARGWLTQSSATADAQTRASQYSYDARGALALATNAKGKSRAFAYDRLGRAVLQTDELGHTVGLDYDHRSNVVGVTDQRGHRTRMAYDRRNKLIEETNPAGQTTHYGYDPAGRLTSVVRPSGVTINMIYDAGGRLIERIARRADGIEESHDTFRWDASSNLIEWHTPIASATLSYDDNDGLLREAVTQRGVTMSRSYTYYANRQVKSYTGPDGNTITYAYNGNGQLDRMDLPGAGSISVTAREWLAPSEIVFPGGSRLTISHNAFSETTEVRATSPTQATLLSQSYQYGVMGELTQRSIAEQSTSYTYDDALHLTEADKAGFGGDRAFTLDAAANRTSDSNTSGTWQYDDANRLIQRGSISYAYDVDGNLISKTDSASSGALRVTHYLYDAYNRLVEVRDANDQAIARYTYDPFSYRLSKEVTATGAQATGAVAGVTLFLQGSEGVLAEADQSGTVLRSYGWMVGEQYGKTPIFTRQNGSYYYYLNDVQGAPWRVIDQAGAVVWAATDYTVDGQATLASGSTIYQPWRLPGQYADGETGLHYNLHRYYDPRIGRYISSDPIGLAGGINAYLYANASPTLYHDANGLFVHVLVGAVVGAVVGLVVQGAIDAIRGESSGWEAYAGAAVNGAIAGAVLAGTGNPWLAGAAGGLTGNLTTQSLRILNGKQDSFNVCSMLIDTVGGAAGGILSKFLGLGAGRALRALARRMAGKADSAIAGAADDAARNAANAVDDVAKGPVRPGDTGSYAELKAQKRAFGETEALDMDHQPSFAAQVAAKEGALGRPLSPAERAAVKAHSPAVASPRAVHQQTSPTYGGRNTPTRIAQDAADLGAAAARDRAAFDEAMGNR
jgi:RHS repeat-associated protein